jgi:cytidylate kinase
MSSSVAQLVARQIRLWEVLKAERHGESTEEARRPCITLSREAGIDSAEVARRIALRLGYSVWDHQVLDFAANEAGVRRQLFEALEAQKQSAVERWVEGALHGQMVDSSDYARALVRVLRVLGEQGGVIVIGRGANFVMPPDSTLRVRIVAPRAWRATKSCRPDEPMEDALRRIEKEDRLRIDFVRRTVKGDPLDSDAYDLILNAERIAVAAQERLILEALAARF